MAGAEWKSPPPAVDAGTATEDACSTPASESEVPTEWPRRPYAALRGRPPFRPFARAAPVPVHQVKVRGLIPLIAVVAPKVGDGAPVRGEDRPPPDVKTAGRELTCCATVGRDCA